jgi:hypothetical protein
MKYYTKSGGGIQVMEDAGQWIQNTFLSTTAQKMETVTRMNACS